MGIMENQMETIRVILRFYGDNGKENGNYYLPSLVAVYNCSLDRHLTYRAMHTLTLQSHPHIDRGNIL